jgi:excisionase family DNA binding protein
MSAEKLALSKREYAQQSGVSLDSVNRQIKRGKIRVINFGRRVLIPATELNRLLEAPQHSQGA